MCAAGVRVRDEVAIAGTGEDDGRKPRGLPGALGDQVEPRSISLVRAQPRVDEQRIDVGARECLGPVRNFV